MSDNKAHGVVASLDTRRILFLMLALGFLWRAVFIYRDPAWITNYWVFEDFGYSLKIARNLALGLGETFDGVVATNGYQPLYVWLMVPVMWVFRSDPLPPLYIALTLLALANVATGFFIFSLVRRITGKDHLALAGVALWMLNLAAAKNGTNGLEAGISTLMVAASLDYFLRIDATGLKAATACKLGLLLGVSFLARVDAVFVAAAVFLMMFWPNRGALRERVIFAAMAGAAFLVVAAPYAAWNLVHFGSPLPTSGQVTTGRSSLFDLSINGLLSALPNVEYGLFVLGRMIAGVATTGGVVVAGPVGTGHLVAALAAAALVLLPILAVRANRSPAESDAARTVCTLALMVLFYMWGYTIHTFVPFERYFLPILLAVIILSASIMGKLDGKRAAVLLFAGAVFFVSSLPYFGWGSLYTPGWFAGVSALNKIAAQGDIVASLQSGNLGYFYTKGRAINLDGVVNMDAYEAKKKRKLDEYLDRNNVRFVADESNWVFNIPRHYIGSDSGRRQFVARLRQRHAAADYAFAVYELTRNRYLSIGKPEAPDGWRKVSIDEMIDGHGLMSATAGAPLTFTADKCFELKFLRHGWSGIAEIREDGKLVRRIDLFSPVQDPTWREFIDQDSRPHTYTLTVSAEKNPLSKGYEVWLDGILEPESCRQSLEKPSLTAGSSRP